MDLAVIFLKNGRLLRRHVLEIAPGMVFINGCGRNFYCFCFLDIDYIENPRQTRFRKCDPKIPFLGLKSRARRPLKAVGLLMVVENSDTVLSAICSIPQIEICRPTTLDLKK